MSPSDGEPFSARARLPGRAGAGGGSRGLGADRGVLGGCSPPDPVGSGGGGTRGRCGGVGADGGPMGDRSPAGAVELAAEVPDLGDGCAVFGGAVGAAPPGGPGGGMPLLGL